MPNRFQIFPMFRRGMPLCKFPLYRFCTIVRNILETASGIDRGTGAGSQEGFGWHFGARAESLNSGLPDGYVEKDVVLYTKAGIITGKILFKATDDDVAYASTQYHKLLQVVSGEGGYELGIDVGYLVESGT